MKILIFSQSLLTWRRKNFPLMKRKLASWYCRLTTILSWMEYFTMLTSPEETDGE